jgi:hypothetical protein
MGIALQLLFTGLGVGSIYALVALGSVLIYRAQTPSISLRETSPCLGRFRWLCSVLIPLIKRDALMFEADFTIPVYG